jgi:YD repeat-containing protein
VWLACNRLLYAGGVGIWLNDDWGPIISPTGIPAGWFSDTDHLNVDIYAGDEGLGVHRVTITPEGKPVIQDNVGYCTGLYGNRCPNDYTAHFAVTGDSFGEGIRTTGTVAEDPTGKTAGTQFTTKVDRTPPEVTLSNQLAFATEEEKGDGQDPKKWDKLGLPVYNLNIEATDGALTSNLTKRSGVKNIEIFLDKQKLEVPWLAKKECPETSCKMTQTYQLKLTGLTSGKHTLEVKAIDFVNKVRERNIEFEYIPATGMKDEYIMQRFSLPDGQGSEGGEDPGGPELAVNVMNGNLVYHERDVAIQGAAVDLEVERFYNSQLPDAQNSEWGDGWTLAQTPDLEPFKSENSPVADKANVVSNGGALASSVNLPMTAGAQTFDPALQSTMTKKSNGGYVLTDETGQSSTSVSFDEAGRTEARLTEGPAKVDYSYEGGVLSEIEVSDPATFNADSEELEELGSSLIEKPSYSSSFGALGSGDGQLKTPGDLTVDTAGNLWVVDKGNNRIEKFDSSGKFLAKFGSLGPGNGQFNRPTSIAIASNGDLLIADAGNGRIECFSSAGTYLSQFGAKGTGNGQFAGSGPEGITIDTAGNIWVSDTYGGRVQKFSPAGAFIKVVSSKGSGTGQLGQPTGIDVDPSGNVWVTDWLNNRVSVFNNNGEFLSQFGSTGTGNGQFSHPDAIEVDNLGNVWVADQSNNRVQQFNLAAQYVGKFGSAGSGAGQFSFAFPIGIAADSKGHLWVADVNNNRIQQWQVPLEKPTYISAFGTNGTSDGQLKTPSGVAVGFGGALWVVDKGNNRIEKFDSSGKFLAKFGSLGSGNGQFWRPAAITVDRDGNLLIANTYDNRIDKFDPQGEFISKFGTTGSGNGQFSHPEGVTTDFKGNIWVADTHNGRLQKFNEEGEFVKVVGSPGSGTGQLGEPTGIDVDPSGNVWVTDWLNNRVSVFNNNGEFLSQFGSTGTGNGQFNHPDAINIDVHNNVWVGDQSNSRVQRFNLAAQYVGQFGANGSGEGQFAFAYPMGIASDSKGHIWVSDVNNNRIQQWQLGNYASVAAEELNLNDGDPSVDVESSGGLIGAVKGAQAGENVYQHVGNRLMSHTGPTGETKYAYDAAGRMTKVTLPNGTVGRNHLQPDLRPCQLGDRRSSGRPSGEENRLRILRRTEAHGRYSAGCPPHHLRHRSRWLNRQVVERASAASLRRHSGGSLRQPRQRTCGRRPRTLHPGALRGGNRLDPSDCERKRSGRREGLRTNGSPGHRVQNRSRRMGDQHRRASSRSPRPRSHHHRPAWAGRG